MLIVSIFFNKCNVVARVSLFLHQIISMKVLIDIKDNQAPFAMEVLRSLSFVKKVNPISSEKEELWMGLKASANEVKLHKQGKLKLKTAQELLNEL